VTSPRRIGPAFRTGAFFVFANHLRDQKPVSGNGTFAPRRAYPSTSESRIAETRAMLVERGLQVMNVGAVGDAYAIAANYLRHTGALTDNSSTDDRLLEIIVQMFHRGEFNRIRLANKAIAQFEAETVIVFDARFD
jgi:hypothetical protein